MQIISTQKFVKMPPKKLRLVADLIRKVAPKKALDILPHVEKKAAGPILKVIKTALANAKEKGISNQDLSFREIQITEGPRLKRGRAVSRGMWHPMKKRMSHIRVVLESKTISNGKIKNEKSKLQVKNKKEK